MTLGKKTAGKSRDSRGLKKKTLTKARKNGTTSKEKKIEYAPKTSTIPDTRKLVIGDNLTYKQLCDLLKVQVKTGNGKKVQTEDWLRYFDYEKNGTRYLITDVYDEPLEKEYKYPSNAIYIKYIEALLLSMLSSTEGNKIIISPGELYRCLGMVNAKYDIIYKLESSDRVKALQDVHEQLTDFDISNFFNRCRTKFAKVVKSAFDSLQRRMLIKYSTEYEFFVYEEDEHTHETLFKSYIANSDQIEYILRVRREALLKCGCDNEVQVYLKKKEQTYYKIVNNRFKKERNWYGVHKIYVINYCRDTSIQALQQDQLTLQRYGLNEALINFLDEQARRNYKKTAALPRYGNEFRYSDSYADLQEVLSYELLNLDSNKKEPILLEIKDLYDNDKWIDLL